MKIVELTIEKQLDNGFCIGVQPFWIHRHNKTEPLHFHILIDIGFWFIELRIGNDN